MKKITISKMVEVRKKFIIEGKMGKNWIKGVEVVEKEVILNIAWDIIKDTQLEFKEGINDLEIKLLLRLESEKIIILDLWIDKDWGKQGEINSMYIKQTKQKGVYKLVLYIIQFLNKNCLEKQNELKEMIKIHQYKGYRNKILCEIGKIKELDTNYIKWNT